MNPHIDFSVIKVVIPEAVQSNNLMQSVIQPGVCLCIIIQ